MSLEKYFPPMKDDSSWVHNPFTVTEKLANFSTSEYENLVELISDSDLKQKFTKLSLVIFWFALKQEFPNLAKRAICILLPFAMTDVSLRNWVHLLRSYKN